MMSSSPVCAAPFIQLTLYPDGNINVCCHNEKTFLGNINTHSFEEIWNGEKIQTIRKQFLANNTSCCKEQIESRSCHRYSARRIKTPYNRDIHQAAFPIRLDLRLNGACNLKCAMCNSSEQPNGIYNSSFLWKEGPEKIFPHLVSLDILGGEPFIQDDTFRLIDIIYPVNPQCLWSFSTNGNIDFKNDIAPRIRQIEIDWIMVSLDSLDPQIYQQIRRNGNWKRAIQTIEELCQFRSEKKPEKSQPIKLFTSMCVQKNNYHEMVDFYNFCITREILPIFHYCSGQQEHSLDNISSKERKDIADFIDKNFKNDSLNVTHEVHTKIMQKEK